MSHSLFSIVKITLLTTVVVACSGTNIQHQAPLAALSLAEIQTEIIKAESLDTTSRNERIIQLATQLYAFGEIQSAIHLVERINPDALGDDQQYIDYVITTSELYIADQSIFKAELLLINERLEQLWQTLKPAQQIKLHRYRGSVYSQLGNTQASIAEYIQLDTLLNDPLDLMENHEVLWQELIKLTVDSLVSLAAATANPIPLGWFQLATINNSYEANLKVKHQQVSQWISLNPEHPASIHLPLDLQLLTALIAQRPSKIALLLPMQGKLAAAGKTIRDGFFAAYYNHYDEQKAEVSLYDTSEESINRVYDLAVNEGADLIIGPLQKNKVVELEQSGPLAVTTLALNYSNQTSSDAGDIDVANVISGIISDTDTATVDEKATATAKPNSLYWFGLSLEDEAVQAADRAWLEGHRYAMVIAADADWSKRAAAAFVQRWQQQGGRVVVDRLFNKESSYSTTIKSALAIDQSQARARGLKRLLGKNVEFEPRRRQDIDMIFLVVRSSEGQQIKPTLVFHYAGNIPVYATSQIYSSSQKASKNRDLNGIRFTTLPWTLDPNNSEKQLISQHIKIPPNYERLYALGVDSFLLHDRLQQLARSSSTAIYGATGKLSLNKDQRIVRQQPWAQVVRGRAVALPYLTQEPVQDEAKE